MIERHPAGRSCAVVLLAAAGILTAGVLALAHTVATQDGPVPATVAPVPAAQVVPATTTPDPTTTTTQTNSAPAAPRALVAVDPTTTQETTVATTPPTDANGVRIAPPPPNQPDEGKDPSQAGLDTDLNPVGPPTPTADQAAPLPPTSN